MSAEADAPLIDLQGRVIDYLRVSVTDRCNYGCVYCIPGDGVEHVERADVLSFEEIAALVRVFASLGVRRVRLTGGEPTVRRDLPRLVRLLREIPELDDIALSTNGHLLSELAAPLRAAGVDRLNVSVDSLDAERFRRITRRGDLGRVLAGIEAARAAGFASIKLNTVAIRGGNDDEFDRICAWAWERGVVPRFIEEMPMADGRAYQPDAQVAAADIRRQIAAGWPGTRVVAEEPDRAQGAGPARYFRKRARIARHGSCRLCAQAGGLPGTCCARCRMERSLPGSHIQSGNPVQDLRRQREIPLCWRFQCPRVKTG